MKVGRIFFEEVLVGLCQYALPKKSYYQEFTLCIFLGINFHCLILEHGYVQGHIKKFWNFNDVAI